MSKLRPTLTDADPNTPIMRDGTAYLLILKSVESSSGLIHGRLHDHGEHCAIGNYFEQHANTGLPRPLIDEVAAINDAVPQYSTRRRKQFVARWLRWKLTQLGMPGYRTKTEATT